MAMPLTGAAAQQLGNRLRQHMTERHAQAALRARQEVEARQGVLPTMTVVDGRRGAAEASVKPGGAIVYLFDATPRVAAAVKTQLYEVAPVDTDDDADDRVFSESFTQLVEGVEASLADMKPGEEVIIVNRQPYDRKLEWGWSIQAPDGVFEVTAKWARSRFGRLVDVTFTYVALDGMAQVSGKAGNASGLRHPCIILRSKVF